MKDHEIVDVYTAASVVEAHFLRGILADEGIEAHVVGDFLEGSTFLLPTVTQPHVWVHTNDAERSREILTAWERSRETRSENDRAPATWKCPTCGSEVDAEMDLCWQCQTPRVGY